MKTVLINECTDTSIQDAFIFDLSETKINQCIGCWTCWWRTPGKCIYKDLEDFYRAYVNADQAVFYAKLEEEKEMIVRVIKGILWVVLLTLLLLGVPRLAGLIANLFDYQAIDPDGAFAWISVHHMAQALIFLLLIITIRLFKPLKLGFVWGNKAAGLRYVLKFTLIFTGGTVVSCLLAFLTDSFHAFAYPMTAHNIAGHLGFQLLLSGPSEELIFRAFAITLLSLVVKKRIMNGKISYANLIAAVIFGLAHISFSLAPFAVQFSTYQVILAIVLGIFYGDCYEKTKSIYYPMMMHSISNIVMVSISILATYFTSR